MRRVNEADGQTLYLLPEIALTSQIIRRLQLVLGDRVVVYHSRLNSNERVELWKEVMAGKKSVVGPRSAIFLPFTDLQLIIVDEEHDHSFKQHEPAPRYNGRDAAVWLAHYTGAKILLGTATPSLETYHNTQTGKYGYVQLNERFGGLQLPVLQVADMRAEVADRKEQAYFTVPLIEELKATLERGEQAILFQNRRGYAPSYRCPTCDWHSECIHCDVSLTYHKHHNRLRCHYCGYSTSLPEACPACGDLKLTLKGYGTEKIEDELKIYLPDANIGRMDLDTTRGKNAHARLIEQFEEGRLDILVGTQMVTKGLDFERVGLVGIISADSLLQFPEFRAGERAFQLMIQVSGRAGRKHRRGLVVIQAYNTSHPVLQEVLVGDYAEFARRELHERLTFDYPPYVRLIRIQLKHKKPLTADDASRLLASRLKSELGEIVNGPAEPAVARVRNFYLRDILLKFDRKPATMRRVKEVLREESAKLQAETGFSSLRVAIDVDPY